MGQVWETTDKSKGQILASMPPGMWSTAWPRDMTYSIVALVRMGHFAEARAALEFQLLADSNQYKTFTHNSVLQTGVGADYRISVCRYYGRGMEETDWNADGPNVEFDGFGLFLWAMGEYVQASGDTTLLDAHWAAIKTTIADLLMDLRAGNGMIRPDSSIWEVHWNGRQKQYTYTSLAAAAGLCQASQFAATHGAATDATAWRAAATEIVGSIRAHAVDGGNFLSQSVEELVGASGTSGYVDAAVVEAFNWGLLDPAGAIADATLARLSTDLAVPNGMGLARNDDGGWYDRSEWVLIDLRTAGALRRSGHAASIATADRRLDWITAQGLANLGLIAELHDRDTADYAGAVPMVGFGAGAYVLDQWLRADPPAPQAACGVTW
jgi:GH15 family glucan-1,4-alpha-glucosidase